MKTRDKSLHRRALHLGVALLFLLGLMLPAAAAVPDPPGAAVLSKIEITGPDQVLAGTTPTYTAQAVYSDGTRRDADFLWTVSAGSVDHGTWTVPAMAGVYTITATLGANSATQVVTVIPAQPVPGDGDQDKQNPPVPEEDELNLPPDMLDHWALEPVMKLLRLGFIELSERGTFDPDLPAVRYDVARLLALAGGLNLAEADLRLLDQFQDGAQVPEYLRPTVAAMTASRLMIGTGCCFDGWGLLTRAQMATIVGRMLPDGQPGELIYPDRDTIPSWALPGVRKATAAGVLEGYPDGTFQPDRPLTRAEMAAIVARVLVVLGKTK